MAASQARIDTQVGTRDIHALQMWLRKAKEPKCCLKDMLFRVISI